MSKHKLMNKLAQTDLFMLDLFSVHTVCGSSESESLRNNICHHKPLHLDTLILFGFVHGETKMFSVLFVTLVIMTHSHSAIFPLSQTYYFTHRPLVFRDCGTPFNITSAVIFSLRIFLSQLKATCLNPV